MIDAALLPAGLVADDHAVHSVADGVGRGDGDVHEPDRLEAGVVLGERQGSGDAPGEAASPGSLRRRHGVVGDHVPHAHPATGSKDSGDLGKDRGLVG